MDDPKAIGPTIPMADRKLAEIFSDDGFEPVQAAADDLVTVTMNARFEVTAVKVAEGPFREADPQAFGRAVQKAVNSAIRDVATKNGERLASLQAR